MANWWSITQRHLYSIGYLFLFYSLSIVFYLQRKFPSSQFKYLTFLSKKISVQNLMFKIKDESK